MHKYYVHHNGHSCFVKEAAYFEKQGGLTEDWGKAWSPLYADSIEDARTKVEKG
jgi:hypothetical protein